MPMAAIAYLVGGIGRGRRRPPYPSNHPLQAACWGIGGTMTKSTSQNRPFTKCLLACWASAIAAGLTAQEVGQEHQYIYQEDLKRLVGVLRQTKVFLGHLDACGNFTKLAG